MTTSAQKKAAADEQAIVRLVNPPKSDEFTLIEVLIAELRAIPEDEPISNLDWYTEKGAAIRRRNARLAAARTVTWGQIANAMLLAPTLGSYLRKAGL